MNAKLDAKTKFGILDMVDPRPIEVIDEFDPETNKIVMVKLT